MVAADADGGGRDANTDDGDPDANTDDGDPDASTDDGDRNVIADGFDVENDDVTADADRVRYRGADRLGGTLQVTDRRVVIRDDVDDGDDVHTGESGDWDGDGDEDAVGRAVPFTVVDELTYRSVDWFTLLLGIGIVAFGLVSVPRNRVGATAFVLVGIGSLAVTWRRRGRVRIHTHGRPKPVTVYPADPEGFLAAVDAALAEIRSERSNGIETADAVDETTETGSNEATETGTADARRD